MSAHHNHGGHGLGGLVFEYFLGGLNLEHLSLHLALGVPHLTILHVSHNLRLPHELLVCLLFAPNFIGTWMCIIVLLFRIMVESTDLFAQCSLGIVP